MWVNAMMYRCLSILILLGLALRSAGYADPLAAVTLDETAQEYAMPRPKRGHIDAPGIKWSKDKPQQHSVHSGIMPVSAWEQAIPALRTSCALGWLPCPTCMGDTYATRGPPAGWTSANALAAHHPMG